MRACCVFDQRVILHFLGIRTALAPCVIDITIAMAERNPISMGVQLVPRHSVAVRMRQPHVWSSAFVTTTNRHRPHHAFAVWSNQNCVRN